SGETTAKSFETSGRFSSSMRMGRIRQALVDLARAGSAVVVISQDLDEIFEVETDIAVICEGSLSRPFPAGELTRERIGLLMGGMHE
ncbi:hypothetical protein AB9F45_36885, partial [Rhizobium leguminosarum]